MSLLAVLIALALGVIIGATEANLIIAAVREAEASIHDRLAKLEGKIE